MYFYSHIITVEAIISELDGLDLKPHHKRHLAALVDEIMQNTILDLVMSQLAQEDKLIFAERLRNNPHDKEIMSFLSSKVSNIEDQIKKAVEDLKKELHENIKEAKKHG